jgi:hypothetical protein
MIKVVTKQKAVITKIFDSRCDEALHQSLLQKHRSTLIPNWYSVLQLKPVEGIWPEMINNLYLFLQYFSFETLIK